MESNGKSHVIQLSIHADKRKCDALAKQQSINERGGRQVLEMTGSGAKSGGKNFFHSDYTKI